MTASPDYCRRLANWMRDHRGLAAKTPLRLEELPPPTCGTTSDNEKILCNYGGARPRTLRATLASGQSFDADLPCAGIPSSAICFEHPPLQAVGMNGYWDVPCSGEGPSGCPTPVVPDSDAVAKARPLVIDELRLPVGAVGHHEVEIGTAVLPNGILSHTSITLAKADQIQHGFIIDPMWVALSVVPTDQNRPQFVSVYERGRFPGLETVKVLLAWDVVETSPDAVVHLQNIEVR